jgi:hypothetical protein
VSIVYFCEAAAVSISGRGVVVEDRQRNPGAEYIRCNAELEPALAGAHGPVRPLHQSSFSEALNLSNEPPPRPMRHTGIPKPCGPIRGDGLVMHLMTVAG